MPGGRLTQEDRRRISTWLAEGLSHAEIGRRLSRPTSTITREVNRNRGPAGYQADLAQRATRQRARPGGRGAGRRGGGGGGGRGGGGGGGGGGRGGRAGEGGAGGIAVGVG